MKRKRDFIITNVLSVLILLAALLVGWRQAALFGLAVLVIMDLLALLGERWPRGSRPSDEASDEASEEASGEDTGDSTEKDQELLPGTDRDPEHVKPDA